ncbi:hypothetical protein D3C75_1005060 [compost metagenome]
MRRILLAWPLLLPSVAVKVMVGTLPFQSATGTKMNCPFVCRVKVPMPGMAYGTPTLCGRVSPGRFQLSTLSTSVGSASVTLSSTDPVRSLSSGPLIISPAGGTGAVLVMLT